VHLLWFEAPAVDRSAKSAGLTMAGAILKIASKRLGPPSEADRVAVIEAMEKLGANNNVRMAIRYLGKFASVDVLEKALTAPTWRNLILGLSFSK